MLRLEDGLRAGTIPADTLARLTAANETSTDEAKAILRNLRETAGMSPEHAALVTRASRLGARELLEVYDAGTAAEKAALQSLVRRREQSYVKHARTSMTKEEREGDPLLARLGARIP